jgi:hypothetical protein
MPRRKKRKKVKGNLEEGNTLDQQLMETVRGLFYLSETDAEVYPFKGQATDSVTKENLLLQIGKTNDIKIEEKDFTEFFQPLIVIEDWYGEEERKMTEKFVRLKDLLQQNLRNLKVFRLGKKEIDIFVVGLDQENILRGIQTKAVET